MRNIFNVFLLLLMLYFANNVTAQTTQASFTGKVSNTAGSPLQGATIQIRNQSTGFTSSTITNTNGSYVFKELPLGGPYFVLATYTGYNELKKDGYTLNQGDVLTVNFALENNTGELDSVVVTVSGNGKGKIENLGAATAVSSRLMTRMPVNGRNFTTLMDLSPLSRGGAISGQLGSSTNYTIDGMNAKNPTSAGATTSRSGAPYSISIEAVREFKVVTNQYDVTYGRAGGGTVSAVTKSGTNTFSGSAFNYMRTNWLTSNYDIRGNRRDDNYSTYQYGFSLGGPIIKDKLHFFAAWDHQQDNRSLIIADVQSPVDENRFNITRNTLDSVVLIGRQKYGLSDAPQYGSFDKRRSSDAAFLRLDWQINDKNLLTLRNNLTNDVNKLGLIDNTAINLYESAGNDFNFDNSLLLTLRSSIKSNLTNELKVQHLYTWQSSEPGDELPPSNIPRAILERIPSTLSDGSARQTNIQFGGHRFAQEWFKNNVVQVVDNLYLSTDHVRYTFGTDLMYTRGHSLYGSEVNGRYHYDGWQNYIDNTPYRYFREVPLMADPSVVSNIYNLGLYGQLQTKIALGMEVTAGLRADYSIYPKAQFSQLVFDELGIRTDNQFKSFIIQPRVQLSWDLGERHKDYIRIGGGVFASDINNYMLINNLTFDGNHFATVDVRSPNVLAPDFVGLRADPSTKPTYQEYQIPTINYTGEDVKIPVIYKANASYTRFITERLKATISGFMTLGRNNYAYVDRNMVTDPFFRLANEDNRGVYVPLNTMPANGNGDWLQGRISNRLGRVLELVSEGKVNQFALVFETSYNYFKDGEASFSYTWNDTKDNTSFNGNVANSSTLVLPVKDDPRNLSVISYSDNQFRSKIVFYATSPTLFKGLNIGVRYSGIGGTRYTLLSGVNSNADFVATNDLAYLFSRSNSETPEEIRTGLQAILDNPEASQSIKDYILKYEGSFAARNGGINGFYGVWDARVSYKISFGSQRKQGVELSADLFNVANAINKKWGSSKTLGTQAIYANRGFDTDNQRFNYSVNTAGAVIPSGNPWQLQLGIRYSF